MEFPSRDTVPADLHAAEVVLQTEAGPLAFRLRTGEYAPTRGAVFAPDCTSFVEIGSDFWTRSRARRNDGRAVVQRSPRRPADAVDALVVDAEVPEEPRPAVPLPWAAGMSSLLAGAVVSYLFSPLFAVLAVVSACAMFGRALGQRLHRRRALKRRQVALRNARESLDCELAGWSLAEATRRRVATLGPVDRYAALAKGEQPWQERDVARLDFWLGKGPLAIHPRVEAADPDVRKQVPNSVTLDDVPVSVGVEETEGLALTGDRAPVLELSRWLLLDTISRLGPSSLGVIVVTSADRLSDWDWLKWSPSLAGIAVGSDEVDRVLSGVANLGRSKLVLADGVEPDGPGRLADLFAGSLASCRLLWIGAEMDVPAACQAQVVATPDNLALLTTRENGQITVNAWGVSSERAEAWARGLSPFIDPLDPDIGARLPNRVEMVELWTSDVVTVASQWAGADRRSLKTRIGRSTSGVVELDLVRDGPHALVAGTTGSGKSELLRTLVAGLAVMQPPELVSMLLIDFKGGGAFDLVAGLPHVAAIVTDLDQGEASRALRSIRAELHDREQMLRDLGVSDVGEVPLGSDVDIPRMVIVVDEFAALAEELPDFLDGLVDVARRGRSLGVHLVLATQRPTGVVTGQIRANTNLRICLRVQDRGDSLDLIDCGDAAELPRTPGRAIIRRGGDVCEMAQIGIVSAGRVNDVSCVEPFVIHARLLEEEPRLRATYEEVVERLNSTLLASAELETGNQSQNASELAALLASLTSTRARAPWRDPLRHVCLADVARTLDAEVIPLGLLDDPDRRDQVAFGWEAARTGLLVIGSDRVELDTTVKTAVAGLVTQGRAVYVLDGHGSLEELRELCAVGDVVSIREPERMAMSLRLLMNEASGPNASSLAIVIHGWSRLSDVFDSEPTKGTRLGLERLVREALSTGVALVVTGGCDRDVPGRVRSRLGCRVVHSVADPNTLLALGVSPRTPFAAAGHFVDPVTELCGVRGEVTVPQWDRLRTTMPIRGVPSRVRVLSTEVSVSDLPPSSVEGDRMIVPIGLSDELEVVEIDVGLGRAVVILGEPGTGRTTTLNRIKQATQPGTMRGLPEPMLIDDADEVAKAEGTALVAAARAEGRPLVVAGRSASARGYESWLSSLLLDGFVVMLQPTTRDGEICRVVVPDMRDAPKGRAVLVDRGRSSIVQLAH